MTNDDDVVPPSEPVNEDEPLVDPGSRRRLFDAVTKRLQNPRQLSGDAMELLGAVLETSDRAKTETVKMVAREVRHYLEELKLREDLRELVTSHSLEVKMSLRLAPLAPADRAPASEASTDPKAKSEPGTEEA